MATWVYFAAEAQANQADTIGFAMRQNVLRRSSRNSLGRLFAGVGNLQAGDTILLVYRQGRPHVARATAKIAEVSHPAEGTVVIERIKPPLSRHLLDAGYRQVDEDGSVEVMHLEDVAECEIALRGTYAGPGTIHRLALEDADVVASLPNSEPGTGPGAQPAATSVSLALEAVQGLPLPSPVAAPYVSASEEPEVAAIRRPRANGPALFDAYVMVDWSSSRVPVRGADSIWVAWGSWEGGELVEGHANESTRVAALQLIRDDLLANRFAGRRVLLGFDFAFGYPQGFASALGLAGPPWEAVFGEFGRGVEDGPDNRHNRDEFAAGCNARIAGGGPGPFWGCTAGAAGTDLTTRRVGLFSFPFAGLDEYRETERRARTLGAKPQSVWKINQGVAVGGQTILGIKYLAALRAGSDSCAGDRVKIWPFDTGWAVPAGADRVVVAEIFPSVLPMEDDLSGLVRDLAQVRTCVRHAAAVDARGDLEEAFAMPRGLTGSQCDVVAEEEGWILFVR